MEVFTPIFKGQISTNVLLFEIMKIDADASAALPVGTVVINADPCHDMKIFMQGHRMLDEYVDQIQLQCELYAEKIIEAMQNDI